MKNQSHLIIRILKNNFFWIGIIIILLGAILFCQIPYMHIQNNFVGVILAFIGILTTFIVISNYAQVKDIESNVNNKIDDIVSDTEEKIANLEHEIRTKSETSIKSIELLREEYRDALEKTIDMQKGIYEAQVRSYYPKLIEYLEIISSVDKANIWKDKKLINALYLKRNNMKKEDINEYVRKDFYLNIFFRIGEMGRIYSDMIILDNPPLLSYFTISEIKTSANAIWWSKDREWEYYKNVIDESAFETNIDEYTSNRFLRVIKEMCPDSNINKLSYEAIAILSGHVETVILNPLQTLMATYESITKPKEQ